MFTYQDRDFPKMPSPNKMHLPVLAESMLDEMSDDNYDPKHDQVDPTLLKLPAALLKGTFAKAYRILTEITAQIGWDTLLKCRSSVFVMEEEYREEKKNSSVATLRGTPRPSQEGGPSENDSETDVEVEIPQTNGNGTPTGEEKEEAMENGEVIIEKPEHTVMPEEVKAGSEESSDRKQAEKYTHIHNKRLCERWLDNLFMVLYEDLRVYTIWRSEFAQYKQQSLPYKKNATEWEVLGELAERLHHHEEALETYHTTLQLRFSPKALKGILADQERRKDSRGALNSIIKLTAWQYRWYSEFSPALLYSVRKLIAEEGAVKVRSIVQATSYPQSVLDLTHHYAQLCMAFRSSGSDG